MLISYFMNDTKKLSEVNKIKFNIFLINFLTPKFLKTGNICKTKMISEVIHEYLFLFALLYWVVYCSMYHIFLLMRTFCLFHINWIQYTSVNGKINEFALFWLSILIFCCIFDKMNKGICRWGLLSLSAGHISLVVL